MLQACNLGKTGIVKLFLDHYNFEECGFSVKNKDGATPFMAACLNGRKDIVKLILEHANGMLKTLMEGLHLCGRV